jgi:hypothetical protein
MTCSGVSVTVLNDTEGAIPLKIQRNDIFAHRYRTTLISHATRIP